MSCPAVRNTFIASSLLGPSTIGIKGIAANSSKTPLGSSVPGTLRMIPPSGFGDLAVRFSSSRPLLLTTQKCPEI